MRVAVLGAQGQLGSELCRQLGDAALAVGRDTLDLAYLDSVVPALLRLRPDVVINAAAYTRVDQAEAEPNLCFQVNATAVSRLVEACSGLHCPLVQISTGYVFGADELRRQPYTEEDAVGPLGVYAQAKEAGERAARQLERHLIVRTCGLYGHPAVDRRPQHFVDTMLRLGRERAVVRVVDDQRCSPTYVPHLARAVLFLLQRGACGTFHVVNAGEATWYDVAAHVFAAARLPAGLERISTATYAAPAQRPAYSVLSTAKYRQLAGPSLPSWRDAATEYLQNLDERSCMLQEAGGSVS